METPYIQLTFKGSPLLVRGYLHGVADACEKSGEIYFDIGQGMRQGRWYLSLLDGMVGTKQSLTTAVVSVDLARKVKEARERTGRGFPMELKTTRMVKSARFKVRMEIFSKELAADIKQQIQELAPFMELTDYDPQEIFLPEGKGQELYAPEHDYTFKAAFKVNGPFRPVSVLFRFLTRHEVIEVSSIKLELADEEAEQEE